MPTHRLVAVLATALQCCHRSPQEARLKAFQVSTTKLYSLSIVQGHTMLKLTSRRSSTSSLPREAPAVTAPRSTSAAQPFYAHKNP